ncbi:MAG: hypothetical protein AAFQ81_06045 [Pseudomonadota bacterium]
MKYLLKQRKISERINIGERIYASSEVKVCAVDLVGSDVLPFLVRELPDYKLLQLLSEDVLRLVRRRESEDGDARGTYQRRFFHFDIVEKEAPFTKRGEMIVRRWMPRIGENTYDIFYVSLNGEVLKDLGSQGFF